MSERDLNMVAWLKFGRVAGIIPINLNTSFIYGYSINTFGLKTHLSVRT